MHQSKNLACLSYVLFSYFLGPRKKLLHYLDVRKAILEKKLSGLEEYQATSVTNSVQYRIGPAGTGQPSVIYPKLDFEPVSFYALGSPIALFNAVRGIESLGQTRIGCGVIKKELFRLAYQNITHITAVKECNILSSLATFYNT